MKANFLRCLFILLVLASLDIMLTNCGSGGAAQAWAQKIARFSNNADTIIELRRQWIAVGRDLDHGKQIMEANADSSAVILAATLFVVASPEDSAQALLESRSRGMTEAYWGLVLKAGDAELAQKFQEAFKAKFDAMTHAEQAVYIASVATPAEAAQNLEPQDVELQKALEDKYADDAQALSQFKQNLKR